jgi:hypothetical protein
MTDDNRFFDTDGAARYLNFSKHTLLGWRAKNVGPNYIRLNESTVRYEKSALDAWLDSKRIQVGDEKAATKHKSPGNL